MIFYKEKYSIPMPHRDFARLPAVFFLDSYLGLRFVDALSYEGGAMIYVDMIINPAWGTLTEANLR